MQTAHNLAAENATLAAARDAITRMVQYLMEDDEDRREVWLAASKDPADYERRRRVWQAREQRARALREAV